ncbi:MAG: ATP-binding protein [Candidatus Paceibacterota bacterium]
MQPLTSILFLVILGILTLLLGFWMLSRNPRSRINLTFFAMVFFLGLWLITHIFMQHPSSEDNEVMKFWLNMNFVGPAGFLSFFVYFSHIFPTNQIKIPWEKILIMSLPLLLIVPAAFMQEINTEITEITGVKSWGWGFYVFHILFFPFMIWAILNFYWNLNYKDSSWNRRALSMIFLGVFLSSLSSALFSTFLPILFNIEETFFLGPGLTLMIFTFVCGYIIIRYDIMDIKIMAKKAFFYAVITALITLLLGVLILASQMLEGSYPRLSVWLIPAIFSIIAVILGFYIWNAIKIAESLKHEFITVVTHKFRTPLTHIMWSIEDLKMDDLTNKQRENVRAIENSSKSVIELVNLLTEVSEGKDEFTASRQDINFSEVLRNVLKEQKQVAKRKGIELEESINEEVIVSAEKKKLRFVINVLIENALTYTPSGGKITATLVSNGSRVRLKVKDNGIGMSKGTQDLVFSTFFRGDAARSKYTEGMGVGLYITKNIIDEFGGDVDFFSEGENKGSTFYVELPVVELHRLKN